MPNTPLRYRPGAIATPLGWANEKTGEQIVSKRNLDADAGTAAYKPNSKHWMADYQASPNSPTPNSFAAISRAIAARQVTVTGKIKYARAADDVVITWGDTNTSTVTPAIDGTFSAAHTYGAAGTFAISAEVGAYTPDATASLSATVA